MRFRSIASSLLALSALAGCGGSGHTQLRPTDETLRKVEQLRHTKPPAYWLGTSWDGLTLVHVDVAAFFDSSLYYADCSFLDLNSLSPRCHRTVTIDNAPSAPGEISTMGRCTFATTIRGATVATFPVNSEDLRVFMPGETTMVGSRNRAEALRAIRSLRPLNRPVSRLLPHRDVSKALGVCRAPKPRPRVHLSAKQRYEQSMKSSFLIQSTGAITLGGLGPQLAQPRKALDEYLSNTANLAPLLRNEADRIDKIEPPEAVADMQHELVDELRAHADLVEEARDAARDDSLGEEAKWDAERSELEGRLRASSAAIQRTVHRFEGHGYSIYVPPDD